MDKSIDDNTLIKNERNRAIIHNILVCWVIFLGVIIIITAELLGRMIYSDYVTNDTITADGKVLYECSVESDKTIKAMMSYLSDTYPGEEFEVCGFSESYDVQVISSKYPDVKMTVRTVQYKRTNKCYFVDNRQQVEQWYADNSEYTVLTEDIDESGSKSNTE
jgi:hypothetical protein